MGAKGRRRTRIGAVLHLPRGRPIHKLLTVDVYSAYEIRVNNQGNSIEIRNMNIETPVMEAKSSRLKKWRHPLAWTMFSCWPV